MHPFNPETGMYPNIYIWREIFLFDMELRFKRAQHSKHVIVQMLVYCWFTIYDADPAINQHIGSVSLVCLDPCKHGRWPHFSLILFHRLGRCSNIKPTPGVSIVTPWSPINPLTAKLFNLNFHPLEVVSR